jgi:hypothetical protein
MYKKVIAGCFIVSIAFVLISCTQKPSQEEMVEKGKYLVNAAGVLWYHTPIGKDGKQDFSKLMAGSSVGYQGPWGVAYPKNLTSDIDTGIGALTDEEVANLIKEESSSEKLSIFNYYYKNLTDEDLKCIVVYLRTLTPIPNKIPSDLKPGETPKTSIINLNIVEPKVVKIAPAKKTTTKPKPKPKPKTPKKTGSTKSTKTKK